MELIGTNLGMLMALRMAGRELGDCPNIEMKTMGGRKYFYSARETTQRARSRIGEDRYHLLFNNCEHFAIWSKTNISESYQVKNKMKYLSVFLRMPVWHYV